MSTLYDRYLEGFYQQVYDALQAEQDQVFVEQNYENALPVSREIMKRVRYNIELLIPRLHDLGYQFGQGFFEDMSPEEKAAVEMDAPIFKEPDSQTPEKVVLLEQLTGTLPLSLKCWYEEVGSVNLVGMFPSSSDRDFSLEYGCILDPLFIYSVEMAIKKVTSYVNKGVWNRDPSLALSPDNFFKYGFGGTGAYSVILPCKAFDAPLLLERHNTTFVNYLRICFRWGGFPGLAYENRLTQEELTFLTKAFVAF
jgi:hypothetical protein